MKDLLGKEPYCYKIHILLMKSSAYPTSIENFPYMVYGLLFLQENLYPPSIFFFFKSQPTHK